jgi:glycerol-3-phosphate O-acyltransferase/dihydroxyacetone phosphate acyltransferase
VIPKVDQAALYEEVTKSLTQGTCICLFPEGGSHDRVDLLPLKAGVAVMALAAQASLNKKNSSERVNIVPSGLNYFHGHRFRSHVLVEYGKPVVISDELMELYSKDRRAAYTELVGIVEKRLKSVTIGAPDLQTLQAILIGRRIYQPENIELTADKYLEVNRRFTETYLHFQHEPRVQKVMQKTLEYRDKLRVWGLHDSQVTALPPLSSVDRYILLLGRIVVLALLGILALPGIILNLPVGIAARTLANRHAKQALAASNVKVSGRDVVASYKILVSMVMWPLVHSFYAAWVVHHYGWKWGISSWFVLFPLYAYATIRIFEIGRNLWMSNLPLFLSLLPGGDRYHKQLLAMREEIKVELRALADEFGPKMPFWNARIITDEHFQSNTSHSVPSRVSYVKKDKKKKHGVRH